jgi:glycosyltransferase involved in cell wall biosynthesis
MPKVSVIIPTYNRADMLGDAIQSVISQTYQDWEMVIVDDGSTDNTEELVKEIKEPRINYIFQENKGQPGARNTGIRNACGEYITFLDSDDLFMPYKLGSQVTMLDENMDTGWIGGGYFEVDRQLNIIREMQPWLTQPNLDLKEWLFHCSTLPSTVMIRREWLIKSGLFDEQFKANEDWDLFLRLSYMGCQMAWRKEPLCKYRIHSGNLIKDVLLMKSGMIMMLDKFFAQPDLPTRLMELRDKAYANIYLSSGERAFAIGTIEEGLTCLIEAIQLDRSLLEGDPPRLISSLASFALSPLCKDADDYMSLVINSIPERVGIGNWSTRKIHGLLEAVRAFNHYQHHEYMQVVNKAVSALVSDPSWFRNRGLLSIAARSSVRSLHNPYT